MSDESRTGLRTAVAGTLLPGFDGRRLPDWVRDRLASGLAGVCLFGENIESLAQLRELTGDIHAANPAAVIAIDEEGGDVTRLFYDIGSPYPGNAVLGRIDDPARTEAVAAAVGAALAEAGVTLDFAPDVDVNSNPDNPVIGVRSFGASAEHVARHSAAWVRGLQSTGVAASAKHFPGHGDTATDSHRALPVVDASLEHLRSRELVPFVASIEAGVKTIMTSHILLPQLDPEHPATLSSAVLGLLRHELGFTGVIVSDALDMAGASGTIGIPEAAARALGAGCDLLCIGTKNTDAQLTTIEDVVLAAVAGGRLSEGRVRAAAQSVRTLDSSTSRTDRSAGTMPSAGAIPTAGEVAASFDVSDWARQWIAAGDPGLVVRLEAPANEAVGTAPWGPFAALDRTMAGEPASESASESTSATSSAAIEASSVTSTAASATSTATSGWWRGADVITVTERSAADLERLGDDPRFARNRVVVIGRDNHRVSWVRRLVDTLRRSNDVLVVDMGWPDAERQYADIATFGASRLVGEALLIALASHPTNLDTPPATTSLHHERLLL
ncbi:glycoside hydrolase family 3 N-terminal domain-containing protein [Subtercola endophyticus]|uniref:glycoside hydrolase family 3 N-terminal domain-containing protein n=1 Tax=Subtercola endophyticus TaxID=2895559 RepID=UPI001E3A6A74|nr:glycoside hydrolase family 3 N-terminal domain-containing protein [Subtercola endophyticus]UFS58989.1 hypothetical protein LQ955_18670 [Subtercola endophyticus]